MAEAEKGQLLALLRDMEAHGIAEDNAARHKAYGKLLDARARVYGFPRFGVFELTPLCNLDCKMCYVHLQKDQLKEQKLISGKEWIGLMEQAIARGMMEAQLTGGEAMMHPDFDEIYLYLYEKGVQTIIMTNGILLTDKRIDFFKKYPPRAIQCTLYGASEEDYEYVTGFRQFQTVTDHLIKAKGIGCKLTISATPSKYFGAEQVKKARDFCKEHELRFLVNSNLNEAREETGRSIDDFNLPQEEYYKIQEILADGRELVPVAAAQLPPVGTAAEPTYGIRCAAGRSMFCMKWNGRMQVCLDIDRYEDPFDIGFEEAWKRLHDFAEHYEIPRECMNCVYRDVCTVCPVQHAMGAKPGHVDRRICERTRRLVESGYRVLSSKKADDK